MTPQRHLADTRDMRQLLVRQQLLSAALAVLCLLLSVAALTKRTTTILEPPSRARAVTVVGDRVDGAWLEEMGLWVAHLMLDATPQSIGWQQEQLLKWVHPATHGDLQQRMTVQAKRMADANAATIFWPSQVAPDLDAQRVLVMGQLETYVNGVKVGGTARTVAYQVTFESVGGRALIKEWKEVPPDDPWLTRATDEQARAVERAKEDKRAGK